MRPYGETRTFRSSSLESLTEKLDRAFADVERLSREAAGGTSRRWETVETVRGNPSPAKTVVAKPSVIIECDTEDATGATPGPTVVVSLPPVKREDAGLESGIIRMHLGGTILLFPIDGAKLDGITSPQALPADRGCYVLVITTRGWWLRRG